MNLQSLLGEIPKSQFVEEYFHRLPFSLAGAAESVCQLGSWSVLGEILRQRDVDMMVVRDGQQYTGTDPSTLEEVEALNQKGFTILVRHADHHHEPLKQLAANFEQELQAPANVHIYATPAGHHGFSWHYDAEDVFIMQTQGTKEYSLRKNTVFPWPLVETIPKNMGYPNEIMPLMRVLLSAGDWLYIPCGYWHKAEVPESSGAAVSLALGVMSPSAVDVYDFLRQRLLNSLLWRQRLPVIGAASTGSDDQLLSRYAELFEQLAEDINRMLRDDQLVKDFLSNQGRVHGVDRSSDG